MIKKILQCLVLLGIVFSTFMPIAYAEDTILQGMIQSANGNGVNLRTGPGVSHERAGGLDDGRIVKIVGEEATNDGSTACPSSKWYKLIYSNASSGYAYVCTSYVKLVEIPDNPNYDFETELAKFPASYQPYLRTLHEIYPNAIFVAVQATNSKNNVATSGIDMAWDTALYNETVSLGKSLIWDSNGSRDGLKNLQSYSFDTNTFSTNYGGGGPNWFAASQDIIAYYLDPRNFLSEKNVFMFETLSYNSGYHTANGVESILSGSYMSNALVDNGASGKKFSDTIMDAGIYSGVSPYFLASRILQEVGYTRSALVKGTYPNYPQFNGYYNYYNIGAGGTDVVYNGLNKAKEQGWDSEYKAIVYGSSWIGNNYINAGQDTQYFQKWDIQCGGKNSCFSKQFMQNIEAPNSEGIKTYNAYKKALGAGMYTLPYLFSIPVYKNMPEKTYYPSESSPINYLSSLVVNNRSVANFYGLTMEYDITLPAGTTSIRVEATAIAADKGATVSGTGDISITQDKQDIPIVVTAANGSKRTYTLHATRMEAEESAMTLEETLAKVEGVTLTDAYMTGLTSVDTVKQAFAKANPNALITIKDNNGKVLTSGNLGTDYTVTIQVNGSSKQYQVVIYGDTNGDGDITILDLLRVQKQLLNALNLGSAQLKSCDVNRDGKVDILDLLLVQKHLLGSKYISQ